MDDLLALLGLPGPSGDEGAVAGWLQKRLPVVAPDAQVTRLGDNLLVVRGKPRVALFAHTDTTGFTLGYRNTLIPIGSPAPRDGDRVRATTGAGQGTVRLGDTEEVSLEPRDGEPVPGTRWIFAREPRIESGELLAPYLDNRAGVWSALRVLERSPDLAIAFTTGEEQHGHGARVCARWLYEKQGLTQALITDITWHTDDTPCGGGTMISLRDANCPRQSYLDRILSLADASAIPYQREIQSDGSSDGGHLLRSAIPMDWVFLGPPEQEPHTSQERLALSDLDATVALLVYLAERL